MEIRKEEMRKDIPRKNGKDEGMADRKRRMKIKSKIMNCRSFC